MKSTKKKGQSFERDYFQGFLSDTHGEDIGVLRETVRYRNRTTIILMSRNTDQGLILRLEKLLFSVTTDNLVGVTFRVMNHVSCQRPE